MRDAVTNSRAASRQRVHIRCDRAYLIVREHSREARHSRGMLLRLQDPCADDVGDKLDAPVAVNPRLITQVRPELSSRALYTVRGAGWSLIDEGQISSEPQRGN